MRSLILYITTNNILFCYGDEVTDSLQIEAGLLFFYVAYTDVAQWLKFERTLVQSHVRLTLPLKKNWGQIIQ